MSVVIRMKRSGRKNRPCYRISVADSHSPRDGRTIESLGLYDPIAPRVEMQLQLDVERAKHWISVGAKPSETVASIFKRAGVTEPKQAVKRDRSGRKTATKTTAARKAAKSARAAAKVERRSARVAAAKAAKASEAGGEEAPQG
ncbi:MAG TPA: 30S ribosomal protein S16 [Planctomycetota bacterium]|nr:30S ribosomal protein S16 [Planctomycetota bacterium]